MRFGRRCAMIALVGVVVAGLAGCSKVTQENYDKIEIGMTEDQVVAILGKGKVEDSGGAALGEFQVSGKVMSWGGEKKRIVVTFVNGKVAVKTQEGL